MTAIGHKIIAYNIEDWLNIAFRLKMLQLLKTGSNSFAFTKLTSSFLMISLFDIENNSMKSGPKFLIMNLNFS